MIEELLAQEEGKILEFKENTKNLEGIIHTIIRNYSYDHCFCKHGRR